MRSLRITTMHTTREGEPKIVEKCTLPLTAAACVDMIITDLAVIEVGPEGLVLREIAAETDLETVRAATGAPLMLAPEGAGTF